MRPDSKRSQNNQFEPKWRHFHPQATLYMKNPFSKDVVFRVADEHNQPWDYRLPAGKISELPGGAIATLGLKEVVDRLIGESGTDAIRIWDKQVRERYEKTVIVRVKEAPQRSDPTSPSGVVDLGSTVDEDAIKNEEQDMIEATQSHDSRPFPGANRNKNKAAKQAPALATANVGKSGDSDLARTVSASLGSKDQVIDED